MCRSYRLIVALGLFVAAYGCSAPAEQSATKPEAPERDGFSGQMGVMAGDPSDYGQ